MSISLAHSDAPSPTLSGLIVGGDTALAQTLAQRLQRSTHVARVERLDDAVALQRALASRTPDLVIHVLGAPDEPLPRCLRKQGDLRVLVVAPDGVIGTLSRWLQQGANDLVSPDDEDGLAHAISRLLDECVLLATLRRQDTVIATQRRRLATLSMADDRRTAPLHRQTAPEAANDGVALQIVKTSDGLTGRRQSLKRLIALQARARRSAALRQAIALQITLPFAECTGGSRLERTLCDLAVFRAAQTVRHLLPRRLLLGRTRCNTLVLLLDRDALDNTDSLVARVRRAMGSLGELLECEADLGIDTLEGPLADLAAANLLERLERRRERRATVTRDNQDDVPVLVNRSPREYASPAARYTDSLIALRA